MKNTIRQPERRQEDIILEELLTHSTQFSDTPENIAQMVVYDGKVWKSAGSLSKAYGLGRENVIRRMRDTGEDSFEAIGHFLEAGKGEKPSEERMQRFLCVYYRGEYYNSPSSAAKAYGISPADLSRTIRSGMTFESAMDYLVDKTCRTRKTA